MKHCASTLLVLPAALMMPAAASAQSTPDQDDPPPATTPVEEDFSLTSDTDRDGGERSLWDAMADNLRVNFDVVVRGGYSALRGEGESLVALGLDVHKTFTGDQGDIGTMVLQPYLVRRDNANPRPIDQNGDDAFVVELHDFYFNLTAFGHGTTNVRAGHFDVPFGLEPYIDTHFTLHQYIWRHDAGFKKDWGVELNGALPELDYAIALTTGTGMDLTNLGRDPYLVSGRIGTPTDANRVLGLSALYGEVIDEHGAHRFDEGNPAGEPVEEAGWIRRFRVGADYSEIVGQWTFRTEVSGGWDFDQSVMNVLTEANWMSRDEKVMAYLQFVYLGQNGFLGWDAGINTRLGALWHFAPQWSLSAQWTHDFDSYARSEGGVHQNDDEFKLQLRWTF